jgi:hypothetical protein
MPNTHGVFLERVRLRIYHIVLLQAKLEPQIPLELQDLRYPVAFTFTESITVSGCLATPETSTEYYTAFVGGTSYYAAPIVATYGSNYYIYPKYTFPQLLLTDLYPGEIITMVRWEPAATLKGC